MRFTYPHPLTDADAAHPTWYTAVDIVGATGQFGHRDLNQARPRGLKVPEPGARPMTDSKGYCAGPGGSAGGVFDGRS